MATSVTDTTTTKTLPLKKAVRSTRDGEIGEEVDLPGFVKLVNIPANEHRGSRTTLIMQRYLLTQIETDVTREEAAVLAATIIKHFGLSVEDMTDS